MIPSRILNGILDVVQTRRPRIHTTRRITGLLMMTGVALVTSGTTSILATDKGCDPNVNVAVVTVARFTPYIRRTGAVQMDSLENNV